MRRCLHVLILLTLLFSSTVLTASAHDDATPSASPAAGDSLLGELGYPEIVVTTDGTTNDFPTELEAGRYHVVLENQSDKDVDLEVAQLPEGMTLEEVDAAFDEAEAAAPPFVLPDFFFEMVWNGGLGAVAGETKGFVLDLTPGEWTVILRAYESESEEGTDLPVTVTVTGEMAEIEDPTGHVEIELVDMDFVVPDRLEAGPQVWHVTNNGLQVHHIVLSRIPEGTTEDQVIELVSSFFAPPATPGAAATPVIEPGLAMEDVEDVFYTPPLSREQVNLYELDLEPGTYAMVCYMPDPSGTAHVMLGMVEIVTVE
jgi:hypothetical protein